MKKYIILLLMLSCTQNDEDMRLFIQGLDEKEVQHPAPKTLSIWMTGCWHTPKDVAQIAEYPFTNAYNQINGIVPYDLIFALGDFDSKQAFPTGSDPDIQDVIDDINVLDNTGELYTIAGNHDAGDNNMDWFLAAAWDDISHATEPFEKLGQTVGMEWERYYLKLGNLLVIMLSDRNDLPFPVGRGGSVEAGGHPSGAVTQSTFDWMEELILAHPDYNIITCHHNLPRETTAATGEGEGDLYHGPSGIPEGRGALWSVYDEDLVSSDDGTFQFSNFYQANPNTVIAHFGIHTHTTVDVSHFGRTIHEVVDGVNFVNVGALTKRHATDNSHPFSSFINLTKDSSDLIIKPYKHDTQDFSQGFYAPGEVTIQLKYPYNPNYK